MIKTTDINEHFNMFKRMEFSNENFDHSYIPEQELRYKIGFMKEEPFSRSYFNEDEKAFYFDYNPTPNTTNVLKVSYEDVCRIFHWESFEFSNDRIYFKVDETYFMPLKNTKVVEPTEIVDEEDEEDDIEDDEIMVFDGEPMEEELTEP